MGEVQCSVFGDEVSSAALSVKILSKCESALVEVQDTDHFL